MSRQRRNGLVEWWSGALCHRFILPRFHHSISPLFHYSIAPLLLLAAAPAARSAESGQTNASTPASVTFNKDIAPIVFQQCAGCHQPGQSAPFNLLSYADVKKRTKQVAEVVHKHYMPPWLPEKGFDFVGERHLSENQIALIETWVAHGAEEGPATQLPPVAKSSDGWQLGTPDLVVKLEQPYTLAPEGKDVYRNFVVPIPTTARKFVKGVEFLPGNWKVVHHAFINVDATPFSRRLAQKDKSSPPGFDGMLLPETSMMPGGQMLAWQPGKMPSFAPGGLSWVLNTNTDLVLQLHLHPSGKPEVVQPTVGFYFTERPPTNSAFRINLNPLLIDIPAGATNYSVEDKYVVPIDLDLIGIAPHAHYLAKRMEGSAILPDGTRKELILIKDWDFNWQGDYRYSRPVSLPKGTTLAMHFSYDNSTNNVRNPNQPPRRVKYGLQTTDEMGELWLQVVPRVPSDHRILGQDFYQHLIQNAIRFNEHAVLEDPNDAEAHTRAGRAEAFLGQLPVALKHFQAAIKANPKYDRAWYELGYFYIRQNNLAEAKHAFEQVVELNPDDYEAEGNLGMIYMQAGNIRQAELHLRAALKINPADDLARQNLERVLAAKSPPAPK